MATRPIINGKITSGYGMRQSPFNAKIQEFHPGLDIAPINHTNEPVLCAKEGKIAYIDNAGKGSFGLVVYVVLFDKWYCVYPHLQQISKDLQTGSLIKEGEYIGLCGNTGLSAGIHLHYE